MKETKNVEVVFQVKGNQKKLLEKCTALAQTTTPHAQTTQTGKQAHGRIEKRTVTVFHKKAYDLGDTWNDHITTVIKVERKTRTLNTKMKQFDTSKETALYISTTDKLSAQEFGAVIRSHWGIENANHYVKDVSMGEDFSRIRKNPECIATLRSFSLNLLRRNGERNISQALYRNATNVQRVLNYEGVKR